eukprot:m.266691 g.266691  ORF g.266691 m.266691 type:complete len:50 (+) comp67701_c0_seq1:420-569(+)
MCEFELFSDCGSCATVSARALTFVCFPLLSLSIVSLFCSVIFAYAFVLN